jgi:CRP-like cAMP-binding protein
MISLIDAISRYVRLGSSDPDIIGSLFNRNELKSGDMLLQEGQVCRHFTFVQKGLFRHYFNNDGKEETFYFSAEGDFVCDYESFISCNVSKKNIVALEPSFVFSISDENLNEFYRLIPAGERFGRLLLEETFIKVINHILSAHTETAEQRYCSFLKNYSHIQQRIPQYYIASFVGVTPQSLSRIRRKMVSN